MDQEHEQRLKASLHYTVGKLCEEQETESQIHFDKPMMATINEILWKQIGTYAKDLEAFAKHAKRSTITVDDVKLVVRRNADLKAKVESLIESSVPKPKDKGKSLAKKMSPRKSIDPPPHLGYEDVETIHDDEDDHDMFM